MRVCCEFLLPQKKRTELRNAKERLENGVDKIAQASAQVADLQTALKEEQIIVEEKKAQTDELIVSIGKEKAVVDEAVEVSGVTQYVNIIPRAVHLYIILP